MENNLRYRHSRNRADQLGQVFTPECIARLLIDTIPTSPREVKCILDLGAGQGALTQAALSRFPNSEALLLEIDPLHANALISNMPKCATVINGDALNLSWGKDFVPDLVLSNPPYGMLSISKSIRNFLSESKLQIPTDGNWIRGDAAFVARAWVSATLGTGVGLIIASPLIRENSFRQLREMLISQLQGLCVTQLEVKVFSGAEVQAFLITGIKASSKKRKVTLRKATIDGTVNEELEISCSEAANRMDFDYYKTMRKLGIPTIQETLSSVGVTITRGSRSNNEFQRLGIKAFHTTTFKEFSGELSLNQDSLNYHIAKSGDILIPRVGTRCLNNQARVVKGRGIFTDCVYRLSVKPHLNEKVWHTISSSFGSEWRIANASGNCAKHLTIQTLLNMPLVS